MLVASGRSRHRRQEADANRFAIELLAPAKRLAPYLSGSADLEQVLKVASDFDISKAAAARRYVALHDESLAIVFSRNGMVRYTEARGDFPSWSLWKGDRIPDLPCATDGAALSAMEEVDPTDWLLGGGKVELFAQALRQADGFAMTLLCVEAPIVGEEEGGGELTGVPAFARRR